MRYAVLRSSPFHPRRPRGLLQARQMFQMFRPTKKFHRVFKIPGINFSGHITRVMVYVRPKRKMSAKKPKKYASKSLVSTIKKVVSDNSETKSTINVQTEQDYSTLTSPAVTYRLNDVVQGTDSHERVGDRITSKMIDIRGSIYSAHQQPIIHKLILLECNKQSDPLDDLMENNQGVFAPAAQDLSAIYARMNTTKYKIHATRVIRTGTVSSTANDANASKLFTMTCKVPNAVTFDEGAFTPQKRVLRLIVFSRRADNDDTLGLRSELTFNSKFYFKDM